MPKNTRAWLGIFAALSLALSVGCNLFDNNNDEICDGNNIDEDEDGVADCLDQDCDKQVAGDVLCEFETELTCDDGDDNDVDELADCLDQDCDQQPGDPDNAENLCEFETELTCNDGFDNDADGVADGNGNGVDDGNEDPDCF